MKLVICTDRRRALLIRIRDEVLKVAPKLSMVEAGKAAQAILRAIGRDPLGTLEECPVPNCSCWMCVLRLNSEVAYHQAQLRVEREAEREVD
jgi:hypothetical protein